MTIQKLTPKQLHEQHNIIEISDYVLIVLQYVTLTTQWKFIGYRCKKCDTPFKSIPTFKNHKNVCRVINTISKKKKE